jgi:hypothetical protein
MRGRAADGRRDFSKGWLMDGWTGPALAPALARAQRKIEQWRQQHRPRARLPEDLWREAAKLACAHGINRIARALRLDYYTLKERAAAAAESGDRDPRFVEVLPGMTPASQPQCMIELEDGSGAKMRIHVQGGDMPDVAALARVFREGC